MNNNYKFTDSELYYYPGDGNLNEYLDYIDKLPIIDSPEIFGLHDNADITKDNQETNLVTLTKIIIIN